MRVRHVGFFSDLPHGIPTEPKLRSVVAEDPIEDEERLIEYLASGALFIASPGVVYDELSDHETLIGSAHIVTDGFWVWPRDLAYYVKQYHARLPDEFIEHARANRWTIPEDIDLESLVFEL